MGGLTQNYKSLEAKAPTMDQLARIKREKGHLMSAEDAVMLAEQQAEKRYRKKLARDQGKQFATYNRHPERKPSEHVVVFSRGAK